MPSPTNKDERREWDAYVAREIARVTPRIKALGFALDAEQPQIVGERYLTRPMGGARKLVLFGSRIADGLRVVIKTSSERGGIAELRHERRCREVVGQIKFAYHVFASPREILFDPVHTIVITEFIEQDKPFLGRLIEEQFSFALAAFKAQESAHGTTYAHRAIIRVFGEITASDYVQKIADYAESVGAVADGAVALVRQHQETIDRYGGFLTHWDFMPQNFRIRDGMLYLLDHASLRFGNKYEGWARFINFMELYNPPLARLLVTYVRDNRTSEESLALKAMRAYRLVELIRYYTMWLTRTQGNLHALAEARIAFWSVVLKSLLADTEVPYETVERYRTTRDALRSEDEKRRQIGLH